MMVVDNHQAGPPRPPVHLRQEAAVELRALLPRAGLAPRVNARTERKSFGQVSELGAVAGLGLLLPVTDAREVVELFQPLQHWLAFPVVKLLPAEEVVPAFHI